MARQIQFEQHIRQALEHINDVAWLEQHSPLASPYFLGIYLSRQPIDDSPEAVLRQLLIETTDAFWDGNFYQKYCR